ncbi:MAG: hypothetical protein C5B58_01295 [Acidobacteria bacterium]|nr:MAG: hypothetical protein C5B58_01295 [Acidobacteriota bacterium]
MPKTISMLAFRAISIAVVPLLAGQYALNAATPTVFATCPQLFEVNGLAATQNKFLFTTQNQPNVYQIDATGTKCSLFATLPNIFPVPTGVLEEYIAISPGLGGFKAGDIFVTQHENVYKISPDGATVTLFATIPDFAQVGSVYYLHSGITFDTTGQYGNQMIVTGQNGGDGHGEVFKISSTGVATKLADLPPGITEGPQVTLASFGPAPNRLLVTQEDSNAVWSIQPNGSRTLLGSAPDHPDAAGTNVIPANLCTLVGSSGAFFTTDWNNGRILKYAASDFTPAGGVLVPLEFTIPGKSIVLVDNSGTPSVFDPNQFVAGAPGQVVHEGSTFVTCNRGTSCPFSPGYWKHHTFPANMTFPVIIGGISYSAADLLDVLNNPGGGNAVQILGFQLAAALLNVANDATVPANVAAAIAQAQTLLNGINLLTGFVDPSSTLGQQMTGAASTLNTFNNTENCH